MLAYTHKLNMAASKPDILANMMEDLTENFQELSPEESYVDVQDEDGRQESMDVFGGKPMEDYPRSLFTAPTNNTQAVDRKKYIHDAFVRAVKSYFAYHVLRTRTRRPRTIGYLHDHWGRMCRTLDRGDVRLLFDGYLKESEKVLGVPIFTYEFEDLWKLLNEKLIENQFNWLQRLVATEVMRAVYAKREQLW